MFNKHAKEYVCLTFHKEPAFGAFIIYLTELRTQKVKSSPALF